MFVKSAVTLPVSFTGSYTNDKPNFPQQNELIIFKENDVR